MNTATLILALVLSSLHPIALGDLPAMQHTVAAEGDGIVLVAVLPECEISYENKADHLREASEVARLKTGKTVLLTEDLLTYLSLLRIERRGLDGYERKVLRSRLEKSADQLYLADG